MSDINDFNSDVYWTVDGKKYGRKVDALLASAQNNNSHIAFHYYSNSFKDCDWIHEPTETFKELAAERARMLRSTSRYLRLWYSGGADSHTMLLTFLLNNIYVDEIVMVRASPVNDFDGEANKETNLRSIPFIKSIQHTIPKTKISTVDITAEQYLDHYKNNEWYLETPNYDFSDDPGILLGSRRNIEKYTNLTMNSDIIEVSGADKPRLIRKDGLFWAPIMDSQFSYLYWANSKEFFTTPEFPKLHVKQCHKLAQILRKRYPGGEDITHDIYNGLTIDPGFKKEWYHCCRQVINYDIDFGKGWELLSPKCQWRANEAMDKNPELFKYYKGGLHELHPQLPHHWKDIKSGISGIMSGAYCIGK